MAVARPTTMWELIATAAVRYPDRVVVSDGYGRRLTVSGLARAAERVATGLGFGPDSVVCWQLPNRLEAIVLMAALARVGAIQSPVIPVLRDREVRLIVDAVRADTIVVPRTWRGFSHGDLARAIGNERDLRVVELDLPDEPCQELNLPTGDLAELPDPPTRPQDCRWVYFSSGTTGTPKGARHSDATLIASSYSITDRLGVADGDVYPIGWPVAHIGAATMISAVLRCGGDLVLFDSFDPATFGDQVAAVAPTILGTGTAFFHAYLDAQQRHGNQPRYPSLRLCSSGGAPTPPELSRRLAATFGVPGAVSSWGLTEFPVASCASTTDPPDTLATTVGPPSRGVQVRVVDGELRLKGPQCFLGYTDSALDDDAFDDDGWFRTGDLGEIGANGYLSITGRRKDIIIRNGENISPAHVEDVLLGHPDVRDVAVLGVPDVRTGERVVAVVVTHSGRALALRELREHFAATGVARQQIPEQVELVTQIPRNAMGKVRKDVLRSALLRTNSARRMVGEK